MGDMADYFLEQMELETLYGYGDWDPEPEQRRFYDMKEEAERVCVRIMKVKKRQERDRRRTEKQLKARLNGRGR